MATMPDTAMILAAGLGTRMRPLTDDTAKPLIEVAGKRLMDWQVKPLIEAGVKRLVVNTHWCADQVEAHAKGYDDVEVLFSDERDEVLETGGALAKAAPLLGEAPVFVVNTDAFWAPNDAGPLQALAAAYDPAKMDELLLLADKERCLGFGGAGDFFRAGDGTISHRGEASEAPWAYAGLRIVNPALYAKFDPEPFSAFRIWSGLLEQGRMHGVPLERFWLHVGDPQALKDANMWLWSHGK
ncbi:nucleotidyltransferase family protein [Henriciella aquimarina]|uniref:nucleotidyltransferase family protein n=1 Tax=Henriciella aquimarina TaxID=545261 RepID=UPI001F2D2334|nr:nucleotidyltransferase family protein [Henriciella aquimarina]